MDAADEGGLREGRDRYDRGERAGLSQAHPALPDPDALGHRERSRPYRSNIFQGELTLDQLLFNRPFPGLGQYRGPFDGFYMCGSGTHPGGGVMGAPGANAAREMLKDFKHGVVK